MHCIGRSAPFCIMRLNVTIASFAGRNIAVAQTFLPRSFGTDHADGYQVFDELTVVVGQGCGSFAGIVFLLDGVIRFKVVGRGTQICQAIQAINSNV